MPKVSVIIPVYNTQDYLKKCLYSVCNQTLKDIEIICINDCSTDNSHEILKEYSKNDSRIKIIDFKENKGAAIARNTGIDEAKGEYIGFVDSDDFIDLDFYEKLYQKAKECSSDLVIGNIKTILNGEEISNNADFKIFCKERLLYGLFPLGLYKLNLLLRYNIQFIDGYIIGEDRLLPIMACYYAKNFEIVEDAFYHCFKRDNSATKNINDRKINDYILTSRQVLEFVNSVNFKDNQYNAIFRQFWDGTLNLFVFSSGNTFNNLCEFCEYQYLITKNKNLFSKIDIDIIKIAKFRDITKLSNLLKVICQRNLFKDLRFNHISTKKDV